MKSPLIQIIFLLFFCEVGFCEAPARIAAWNVASGRNDAGGTPIPEERIERLAKIIATKIKPDVLVMSEVWPISSSAAIAEAATKAGFAMEAVEIPAQDPEVVQLITIIKRPGVEVKNVELIADSNDLVDGDDPEEKTTRKAVLAEVRVDKLDFYLVGVHLKSKRPSRTIDRTPMEMRDRQCKAIALRMQELLAVGTEKDVMIVGDYNMTPEGSQNSGEESDTKNFETLNSNGNLRFISSESKEKSFIGFYRGRFQKSKLDGFAIARATEAVYLPKSYREMNHELLEVDEHSFGDKKSPTFLSDHLPMVAEFDKTKDLD